MPGVRSGRAIGVRQGLDRASGEPHVHLRDPRGHQGERVARVAL